MKRLVDQLCDAIDQYLSITADHPENVVGYFMMITGGEKHIKGEGALSKAELAQLDPGSVTGFQRHGHYKVSHLREWLNYLCYEFGMMDIFLIPSLIKHYQQFLTDMVLDEEVVERRQKYEKHLESLLESKELRDEFFDRTRRVSMDQKPMNEQEKITYIKKMLDGFRNMPLESVSRKRDKLRVWENETSEIASGKNLNEYISEMARATINEYLDD